ncbi:hypothetical protein C0J52_16404, partial [Blattella germanica]
FIRFNPIGCNRPEEDNLKICGKRNEIHILTLTSQLILWLQASHICGTPLPINILSLLGYPYGRDNLMEIEKQRSLGKISEPNDTYSINYPLMEAQSKIN